MHRIKLYKALPQAAALLNYFFLKKFGLHCCADKVNFRKTLGNLKSSISY